MSDYDFGEETKPYWFCEECGYKNEVKKMPLSRKDFYKKENPAYKCPSCGSQSLMPKGW